MSLENTLNLIEEAWSMSTKGLKRDSSGKIVSSREIKGLGRTGSSKADRLLFRLNEKAKAANKYAAAKFSNFKQSAHEYLHPKFRGGISDIDYLANIADSNAKAEAEAKAKKAQAKSSPYVSLTSFHPTTTGPLIGNTKGLKRILAKQSYNATPQNVTFNK